MKMIGNLSELCNSLGILTNTNILTFKEEKLLIKYNSFSIMDNLDLSTQNINQIKSYLLDENNQTLIFEKTSKYNLHYISSKINNTDIFFIVGPFLTKDPHYEKNYNLYNLKKNSEEEYDFYLNLKKVKTISTNFLSTIIYNLLNSNFSNLKEETNIIREVVEVNKIESKKINISLEDINLTDKRYNLENKKLKYIKLGDYKTAIKYNELLYSLSEVSQRIPNNLFRSFKNGLFISSGIIRKSVEQLDIPPTLIHNLSSKFFSIIEQCSTLNEFKKIEEQMIKEYSLLCLFHQQKYNNFNPKIKKALLFIDINIKDTLSLISVSEFVGLNPEYFSRLFKSEVGTNFKNYVKDLKINIIIDYILNKKYKTSDIAFRLGYSNVSNFSNFFKKNIGLTPSEFRKKNLKNTI